ncbi:MAG: hypothetical protein ACE14L_16760 [Terriglobales bacterium]
MRKGVIVFGVVTLALAAAAQVTAPPPATSPPAAGATPQDFTSLLPQLQQAAQSINLDIARLRIEKWKTEGAIKEQAQQNADSISRNISAALPGMTEQVRANPQSLAAAVKLYRNVNALYDVFSTLAESAGAFGPKQEYETLSSDAARLDSVRRTMGERLEGMAAANDAELVRLRTELTRATTPPPPPMKIIIDDDKPAKPARKPAKRKPAAQPATQPPGAM